MAILKPATGKKRSRFTRLGLLLLVVYLLTLLEIAGRVGWYIKDRVPIFQPTRMIDHYYEPLGELARQPMSVCKDDETFDVLLLGGSAVSDDFGNVASQLEDRLAEATSRSTKVWNMGQPGHTTRDSFIKYQNLHEHRFDLVLVYHGINDLRMNNCPPELFRDDYTHCKWYREVEFLRTQPVNRYFVIPFTGYRFVLKACEMMPGSSIVPMHVPKPDWVRYGESIKTEQTFRENVTEMIRLASQRGETLALGTFACYIPDDYSQSRFADKQLDYAEHRLPVEIWGDPRHIASGIQTHNGVTRQLARQHHLPCVEIASAVPHDRYHFNDCCHLTEAGCRAFVDEVITTLGQSSTPILGKRFDPDVQRQ